MIPYDLFGALREDLQHRSREGTPKLYCSGDLLGSLRHAQLRMAGAPYKPEDFISLIRLKTGNLWHDALTKTIMDRGWPVMHEVRLSDYLPEGWGGRADHLWWDVEKRAFRLSDLKTTKGEGMKWLARSGAKDEYLWQLSAYYHALVEARFPMVRELVLIYLPMNDVVGEQIEPELVPFEPVPKEEILALMKSRWEAVQVYLEDVRKRRVEYDRNEWTAFSPFEAPDLYLRDSLAPPMERIQKLFKNGPKHEVKLVPHWSTMFCPYENDLCDCSEQGVTKIGEYVGGTYKARKGYEAIEPTVAPPVRTLRAAA